MSGVIMTITGPSASGKSTLERMLTETGEFERCVSVTTRERRANETDGIDYHFVTKDRIDWMIGDDEMADYKKFEGNGQYYGVTKAEIQRIQDAGKVPVLVCEPGGAENIRNYCDDNGFSCISVFVTGKLETLVERFVTRSIADNVSAGEIAKRVINLIKNEFEWHNRMNWDVVAEWFDESNESTVVSHLQAYTDRVRERHITPQAI